MGGEQETPIMKIMKHTTTNTALTTASASTNATDAFFAEQIDLHHEARLQALEVITRFLIWIAEGSNLQARGVRATIALYCVRPDLIDNITLEKIGQKAGITKQAAYKLAHEFRLSVGLVS